MHSFIVSYLEWLLSPQHWPEICFNILPLLQPRKDGKTNGVGPLDPYADDDEDQLKNLAKNLENKYVSPEIFSKHMNLQLFKIIASDKEKN